MTGSCSGICIVEVGTTSASASKGSSMLLLIAFFMSSCCNCRLFCATIRFCWLVATMLWELTT